MKKKVAILGATGTVGQKIICLIEKSDKFEVGELVASEKSEGKTYRDAVHWREQDHCPEYVLDKKIIDYKKVESKYVLSSLPSDIAFTWEKELAKNGHYIVSNASAYRMDPHTPLLVPEINPSHLDLLSKQKTKGKIITNPNCSVVFLALGLAPLTELGKINHVDVVTLQAVSGAGYPGISSLDILGNIIPNIKHEEEKIEEEVLKILGKDQVNANFTLMSHVNRVPVEHGHTICFHVHFDDKVSIDDVTQAYHKQNKSHENLYKVYTDQFSPQPKRDFTNYDQRCHIGRPKISANGKVVGLIASGHNLVRGAAGAALLNLELLDEFLNN